MPRNTGQRPSAYETFEKLRPYFTRLANGEPEVVIPCPPEEQAKLLGQCGISLRFASNIYLNESDENFHPFYKLCGALKFTKVPDGVHVAPKKKGMVRPIQTVAFTKLKPDGTSETVPSETIQPETIPDRIKKSEREVIARYRGIMRHGMSMLNRVNAAQDVLDKLSDDKVAPDFKDKLLDLREDAFDVFEELVELDLTKLKDDYKGKEMMAMEGAQLKAVRYLSERTGENKVGLWPPKQDAAFRKRMERARAAACCTTETPGRIFENPAVLICFYDDDLNSGKSKLHGWQIEELSKFARALQPGEIHRQSVAAANGSGKSKNLGAPCGVWGSMEHASGVTVLTTASGKQLDKQSAKYINAIARQVNRYHGGELWRIQYRNLKFQPIDSDIEMFATDEPGQAEGWHPKVDGGYFAILVDEAKTVSEEIFSALQRCNGCTRRLDYSSPGQPAGHFYEKCTGGHWMFRRVTAYDCPHILKSEIDEVIRTYGENSPLTRSIIHAEFTSLDGNLVLTWEKINRCIRQAAEGVIEHKPTERNRAGLDLAMSAGGDESVISIWNGNKMLDQHCFREADLEPEVDKIIGYFKQYNLRGEDVVADAGGLGKPIISRLKARGYNVTPYYAQSPPRTTAGKNFASRGTEAWHHFGRLVEESEVILKDDAVLKNQLANRYYRATGQGKIVLESKREAKAAGHPSPDRADAAVLANVQWAPEVPKEPDQPRTGKSIEEIMAAMEDQVFRQEDSKVVAGSFPTLWEVCG